MTLKDALLYAKDHGGYVAYNDWKGGDENSPQHYWIDGMLQWDHWGTVGGEMPEGLEDKRIKDSLDMDGFDVYTEWNNVESKVGTVNK